jgi:hypothetical protein
MLAEGGGGFFANQASTRSIVTRKANLAAFRGFTKLPHPKSRTVRKIADQPANPDRPGVRGVRDRPTDFGLTLGGGRKKQRLPNKESSARGAMPTRISLRRVGSSTRKLMAVPDSLAELLENATKKLKLPSDAKNKKESTENLTDR